MMPSSPQISPTTVDDQILRAYRRAMLRQPISACLKGLLHHNAITVVALSIILPVEACHLGFRGSV